MIFLSIIFVVLVTIIRFNLLEKINLNEDAAEGLLVVFWILSSVIGGIFCIYFWEASPLILLFVNKEHITRITGFFRHKILEFIREDDKEPQERNSYCALCGDYIVENKLGKNYTECEECRRKY